MLATEIFLYKECEISWYEYSNIYWFKPLKVTQTILNIFCSWFVSLCFHDLFHKSYNIPNILKNFFYFKKKKNSAGKKIGQQSFQMYPCPRRITSEMQPKNSIGIFETILWNYYKSDNACDRKYFLIRNVKCLEMSITFSFGSKPFKVTQTILNVFFCLISISLFAYNIPKFVGKFFF